MKLTCGLLAVVLLLVPGTGQAAERNGQPVHGKRIFNGRDLTGWSGDTRLWSVKDGAIVGQTTAEQPIRENTFLIWTGGAVKDFELRLLFRLHSHNSGIQYRSRDLGLKDGARSSWAAGGYQADMDAANKYTGILYEERGRGILATVGQKVTLTASGDKKVTGQTTDPERVRGEIRAGGWNEYVIICRGNHIIHKVNGLVTVDVTDEDASKRSMEGILALQLHQGPPMKVEFKDITLK